VQIRILCPLDRSPQMPRGLLCRHYGYVHVPKRKTPHLLGPGRVWRKCYIVHPRTQALDPLMKYQWLTHTAVVHGLPERVTVPSLTDNCNITQCVERAREVLVCQLRDELTQAELSAGFLQSTLAGMWMQACGQQHLINSSLTFEPHVESYWRRGGDNFLCISKPMYILHTYRPLDLFCDPDLQTEGIPPFSISHSTWASLNVARSKLLTGNTGSDHRWEAVHLCLFSAEHTQSVSGGGYVLGRANSRLI